MATLLQEAEFELSNAIDLIVEFSGCTRAEVLQFSKVKGIVETQKALQKELELGKKLIRPVAPVKHTRGEWTITGETANMIIVKSIHSNGNKRTVAKIPFTTDAQDEKFGMTDHFDAKLIKNAPVLKQIAEMFFDHLGNGKKEGIVQDIVAKTLKDINE